MTDFFFDSYKNMPFCDIMLEFLVFLFGILSVWLAKKESVWAYPTGLIATIISTYLFFNVDYLGDTLINAYFSIMSIYGWYNWAKKGDQKEDLPITRTTGREKIIGVLLFFVTIFVVFGIYNFYGKEIKADNYVDIFISGIFFTGMWYMALKKIENWTLWIIADIIAVPLYAYRGFGMLSLQYIIFTILAIFAYLQWRKILNNRIQIQ